MTIEEVPAPAIPDGQRQLLDIYRLLIREAVTLAGPAGKMANASPANFVVSSSSAAWFNLVGQSASFRCSATPMRHKRSLERVSMSWLTSCLFGRPNQIGER